MFPRLTLLLVSLAVSLALLLSGCASPGETTSPTTAPTSTPTGTITATPTQTPTTAAGPTGKLRIAVNSFAGELFDPAKEQITGTIGYMAPLYDHLVRLGPKGELVPGLLEKWELAADGLSWTYTVRKGITFHNGEVLNADDVKFSIDRYTGKDGIYADLRNAVDRAEVIDESTVRVYTKGVQVYLPYFSSFYTPGQGQIMPKDYFEANGADYYRLHPVGSGPFKFVRSVPGDVAEYTALPKHWRQTAAYKDLSMILMPEETTRQAALKTGEIEAAEVSLETAKEGVRTITADLATATIHFNAPYHPLAAGMPVSDVRVRQALSLAIDRDDMAKNFFYGKALPATPSGISPSAQDIDIAYWTNWAKQYYNYDLEKAKQLLKDAGYPDGFKIKIYAWSERGADYVPKLAEIIQGYWQKVGVKAEIVPIDQGAYRKMRVEPAPEIIGQVAITSFTSNPIATVPLTSRYTNNGNYRLMAISPKESAMPEIDKLVAEVNQQLTSQKRGEVIGKIIELTTPLYVLPTLVSPPSLYALSSGVDFDFGALPNPVKGIGLLADLARPAKK